MRFFMASFSPEIIDTATKDLEGLKAKEVGRRPQLRPPSLIIFDSSSRGHWLESFSARTS